MKIEVNIERIEDLFKAFINSLEKCKCGIISHEYKINIIIEDWKKKIVKWKEELGLNENS